MDERRGVLLGIDFTEEKATMNPVDHQRGVTGKTPRRPARAWIKRTGGRVVTGNQWAPKRIQVWARRKPLLPAETKRIPVSCAGVGIHA